MQSSLSPAASGMLFEQIEPERALRLLTQLLKSEKAQRVAYPKNAVIYSPESYRKSLGILLCGRATIEKPGGVLLHVLEEGDCFGVAALFAETKHYVSTIRTKGRCELLFLSAEGLRELFLEEGQIALNYISFLSGRIQFLNHKIDSFAAPSAEENLLCYLRELPSEESAAGERLLRLSIPLAQLAQILNLGRSSLYRALDALEEQGALRRDGKKIYLPAKEQSKQSKPGDFPTQEKRICDENDSESKSKQKPKL